MRNETRKQFSAYVARQAELNGVSADAVTSKFTATPSVQQTLETHIQESSAFLQRINMIGVPEQEGEKVGLGVGGPIASTTDTSTKDRATKDVAALDDRRYRCEKTDYDTHIRYAMLDAWAKFPDFQTRLRDVIVQRCALDRIMIGFNGVSRAATSNPATNPLLQDVNKGWLQHYRAGAPNRVMTNIKVGGDTPDYNNLDALVMDAVSSLVDPWFRQDPNLVVICGEALVHSKYFKVVNAPDNAKSTEQVATDVVLSSQRIGGKAPIMVPYFPANAMLITRLDNLGIYWQMGTNRRAVIDNPKRDRIETYQSSNDAYVVEDFGAGCLIENIVIA